ncbi:MAG: hypothetical protein R3E12_18815 [Candidatus Eisenbacteria bacterium]|uniref:Uncharacterized protein n=1 Tax=Eiseniibacteriota bacterium TaxID=2212470 RepID=A0A956M0S2_UNCEI|nr:hypothetical protein [Candidatus Eisenbacteria bacterium]
MLRARHTVREALAAGALGGLLALPFMLGATPARAMMPLLSIPGGWVEAPLTQQPAGVRDGVPPASGEWIELQPVGPGKGNEDNGFASEVRWLLSDEGPIRAAETRAGEWLGVDELEFGSSRLSVEKEVGDRIRVTTFTGYQASSQREVRVEYHLGRIFYLRSEARERGESAVSLRSDLLFW